VELLLIKVTTVSGKIWTHPLQGQTLNTELTPHRHLIEQLVCTVSCTIYPWA